MMLKCLLCLTLALPLISAECCGGPTRIRFSIANYPGQQERLVCANGKFITGYYCGVGPCDVFGCKCEGGCHTGDVVENFKRNFPDVKDVEIA